MRTLLANLPLIALVFLISGVGFTSCGEDQPTEAEIFVIDSLGDPVEEAQVILYCVDQPNKTPCVVQDTQTTDAAGRTLHAFENPAVLKILATKEMVVCRDTGIFPNIGTVCEGDTLCAEGFVTLEEYEKVQESVVLLICRD